MSASSSPTRRVSNSFSFGSRDRRVGHFCVSCFFFFFRDSERDIVQREELVALAERFPNVHVYFNLDRPSAGWAGGKGFVTADTLEESNFPKAGEDTMMLVCGPPPMCQAMERLFDNIGCAPENRFIF